MEYFGIFKKFSSYEFTITVTVQDLFSFTLSLKLFLDKIQEKNELVMFFELFL